MRSGKRRSSSRSILRASSGGESDAASPPAISNHSHFDDSVSGWLTAAALAHAYVRVNVGDSRRLFKFSPGKSGRDAADSPEFISLLVSGASEGMRSFSSKSGTTLDELFVAWVKNSTDGAFQLAERWKKLFVTSRILGQATTPFHVRSALAAEVAKHPPTTNPAVAKILERQTLAAMREAAPSAERVQAMNDSLPTGARFISASLDATASGMADMAPSTPPAVHLPRPTHAHADLWHAVDVRMFPGGTVGEFPDCLKWDGIEDDLAHFKRYEAALLVNAIDKGLVPPRFTRAVLGRFLNEQGIVGRDIGDRFNLFGAEKPLRRSQLSVTKRRKRSPPSAESEAKRVPKLDEAELEAVRRSVAKSLFSSKGPDIPAPSSSATSSAAAVDVSPAPTVLASDPAFSGALAVLGDGKDIDKSVVAAILKEVPDLKRRLLEAAPSVTNAKALYIALVRLGF